MPLPFILAGAAIATASVGAKKGYDGYQDRTRANEILKWAESEYEEAKENHDDLNNETTENLERLGKLQLDIGSEFDEFRKIAKKLLDKLNESSNKDIKIQIPEHRLNQIDNLAISTTSFIGKVAGGAAGGAAAAYAVYGGTMALAAASTGTPIAALSGAAAYNATMAAIGGGALSAGGFGMAGGAMVLGGVVAAPIIAVAGWAFASHAEDALDNARKARDEVEDAVSKFDIANIQLKDTIKYVKKIYKATSEIHTVFISYFDELKKMNDFINKKGDMDSVEKETLQIIANGYKVAAILTDIITTPLFKPKMVDGKVELNEEDAIAFETDENDLQILNKNGIDEALKKAKKQAQEI